MATIYIVSSGGKITKKNQTLQVADRDGTVRSIFPHKTEQLLIVGNVEFTGQALKLLMHHKIDTVFMGKNGRYNGKLAFNESKNVFLRQKQYRLLENREFRVGFARAIVQGKLRNQLAFTQRIQRKREDEEGIQNAIEGIKQALIKCEAAESIDSIRGYEGFGSRQFFSVFPKNIIQDWAVFNGRSMHPPEDNVNAVLSFLYTLLFYRVDAALEAEGLDSYAGFLHTLDYGKRSLSFDIMEEFRTPIADTLTCAMFNLGVLEKEDFEEKTFTVDDDEYPLAAGDAEDTAAISAAKTGVLLTRDGIKKVITQLERKLDTQYFYKPTASNLTYKRIIHEQVKQLKRVISGEQTMYKPHFVK